MIIIGHKGTSWNKCQSRNTEDSREPSFVHFFHWVRPVGSPGLQAQNRKEQASCSRSPLKAWSPHKMTVTISSMNRRTASKVKGNATRDGVGGPNLLLATILTLAKSLLDVELLEANFGSPYFRLQVARLGRQKNPTTGHDSAHFCLKNPFSNRAVYPDRVWSCPGRTWTLYELKITWLPEQDQHNDNGSWHQCGQGKF